MARTRNKKPFPELPPREELFPKDRAIQQQEAEKHVNALLTAAISATLDAATGVCKCSVCKVWRENAHHVRALLNIGQRVKHIEVVK